MTPRFALLAAAAALIASGCAAPSVVTAPPPAARPAPRSAPRPAPTVVYESPTRPAEPAPTYEPAPAAEPLVMPVDGYSLSRLSDQYQQPRSGGRTHEAIDLGAPTGTRIVAAAAGRVLRKSNGGLGGITVTVQSLDGGLLYYYAHLSRYAEGLQEGQRVAAGDLLGYVGTTGNATVPHLHFAIWPAGPNGYRSGTPVNPYPLLAHGTLPPTRRTPAPAAPETTPRRPAVTVTRVPQPSDPVSTPRAAPASTRRPAVTVTRTPTSARVPQENASPAREEASRPARRPAVAVTPASAGPAAPRGW